MGWEIRFFKTNRGGEPVKSFIHELDQKSESKVFRAIDLLAQYGPRVQMPQSRKMSGDLYELRTRGKVEIRIFYTFRGQAIYLLHAFQKKTQATPQREIVLAANRSKLV